MSNKIEIGVGDGSGIQVYVARPGDTVFLTIPDRTHPIDSRVWPG